MSSQVGRVGAGVGGEEGESARIQQIQRARYGAFQWDVWGAGAGLSAGLGRVFYGQFGIEAFGGGHGVAESQRDRIGVELVELLKKWADPAPGAQCGVFGG